jgi:hypothetical protein
MATRPASPGRSHRLLISHASSGLMSGFSRALTSATSKYIGRAADAAVQNVGASHDCSSTSAFDPAILSTNSGRIKKSSAASVRHIEAVIGADQGDEGARSALVGCGQDRRPLTDADAGLHESRGALEQLSRGEHAGGRCLICPMATCVHWLILSWRSGPRAPQSPPD